MDVALHHLHSIKKNEIKQELTQEKNYFWDDFNERLYIDMRRNRGYTDELEKLTCVMVE